VPLMQGKYSFGMHLHVAAAKPRLSGIHLSGKPTIRTSFPGNENMQPWLWTETGNSEYGLYELSGIVDSG